MANCCAHGTLCCADSLTIKESKQWVFFSLWVIVLQQKLQEKISLSLNTEEWEFRRRQTVCASPAAAAWEQPTSAVLLELVCSLKCKAPSQFGICQLHFLWKMIKLELLSCLTFFGNIPWVFGETSLLWVHLFGHRFRGWASADLNLWLLQGSSCPAPAHSCKKAAVERATDPLGVFQILMLWSPGHPLFILQSILVWSLPTSQTPSLFLCTLSVMLMLLEEEGVFSPAFSPCHTPSAISTPSSSHQLHQRDLGTTTQMNPNSTNCRQTRSNAFSPFLSVSLVNELFAWLHGYLLESRAHAAAYSFPSDKWCQ